MKTLRTKQTVKLISVITLSLVVFGSALFAQPTFQLSDDYTEDNIRIEEWMTNYESFEANLNHELYTEDPMEIQAWMLNSNELLPGLDDNYTEELLAIEDWMIDYNAFSGEVEEPMLAIENWMLDYNTFSEKNFNVEELVAECDEEPMEIEAWMTDLNVFNTPTPAFIPSIKSINLEESEPLLIALHDVK